MRPARAVAEAIAAVALVWQAALIVSEWSTLPARVPVHFGPTGLPDRYGDRSMAALVPCITAALWLMLTVIRFFPRSFNYPVRVTDANRPRLEPIAISMLAWLKAELCCALGYITWQTLRVARGQSSGLGPAFLPIGVAVVGGTVAAAIIRMRRAA